MYLIAIAWMYVVVMMAVAEATGTGTVLGAIFTLLLYGVLPLGIVLYIFGSPGRRQMRRRREAEPAMGDGSGPPAAAEGPVSRDATEVRTPGNAVTPDASIKPARAASLEPDGGDHAAGLPIAPEGKEPGRL